GGAGVRGGLPGVGRELARPAARAGGARPQGRAAGDQRCLPGAQGRRPGLPAAGRLAALHGARHEERAGEGAADEASGGGGGAQDDLAPGERRGGAPQGPEGPRAVPEEPAGRDAHARGGAGGLAHLLPLPERALEDAADQQPARAAAQGSAQEDQGGRAVPERGERAAPGDGTAATHPRELAGAALPRHAAALRVGTEQGGSGGRRLSKAATPTPDPFTQKGLRYHIGSWTWTTPERSSPAGGRTTTTFDLTAAWVIFRPSTSGLAELSPPPPRGSKTHPRSGPKLGGGAPESGCPGTAGPA